MKVIAAVFADFETAPAGGPSQLATTLGGVDTLTRTLRRVAQVQEVAARLLCVRPRDAERAAAVLAASGVADRVELFPEDTAPRPRRKLLTAARKWGLEAWRGGVLGTSWFDEFVDAQAVAQVLQKTQATAALCLDGHMPFCDPAVATGMIRHALRHPDQGKVIFTQAPPGLAGLLLRVDLLQELLENDLPVGLLLAYRPEMPTLDPIIHTSCYQLDPVIAQTAARLTADTRHSRELLTGLLADLGDEPAAEEICRWLAEPGRSRGSVLPVEIELELTTADPLPETTLRIRGERVPTRHLDDLSAWERIARELGAYDDRIVVFGGHGDPLQHQEFAAVCGLTRAAGIWGLAVTTPLVDLSDAACEALFEHEVDVVEVQIDAHSAATYRRMHGRDAFAQVIQNVDRLEQRRRRELRPRPIVLCSLTRCAGTLGELEAFYDTWVHELGGAVLQGYNDYCGRLPADTLLPTTPLVRGPCRRLDRRLLLLADGRVARCGQDVDGEYSLGAWRTESLAKIWSGERLEQLRVAHRGGVLESLPMCQRCQEWNRP